MFKNPIIPGFFPDPSIIRVEDDFYLINSSFEYFPAIPIWHSKDLVHWRQIGNAVDRKSQKLDLSNLDCSKGVQAASIRYHKGTYYITSTRIQNDWPRDDYHFIMYTNDINGPWSEVIYLKDAYGIDSSLFFDDDKAYFIANRQKPNLEDGGDTEIWIQEIDLGSFTLVGEKHSLWDGTGGIFPEGPHIYKRNGYYYLLIAEGGTLHNHTVTIARSENVFGPYESSVRNPILTHKHLDRSYPIMNVGHADLVELKDGSWYGVCLGSRPSGGFYNGGNMKWSFGGYYRNMGRETFLFPVSWPTDDVSPLFSPMTGKVEEEYPLPNLTPYLQDDVQIDFSSESLHIKWCVIKKEDKDHIELKNNVLELTLQETIEQSFIGFRQDSWEFDFKVTLDISNLTKDDFVSVTSYMIKDSNLQVQISMDEIRFVSRYQNQDSVIKTIPNTNSKLIAEIHAESQYYGFVIKTVDGVYIDDVLFDGRVISSDLNNTHTGSFIALTGQSLSNSIVECSNIQYKKRL